MSLAATYDLADALYRLAPWEAMFELELIAIRHPENGRIDHISIMGREGTHYCLALYLGPEARRRFNLIQDAEFEGIHLTKEDTISLILDTRQLQVSFLPRSELFASELAAIKRLGRKYRGANWPSFRSFKPGHAPPPADPAETEWLATAIAQVLEVAPTLRPMEDDTVRPSPGGGTECICREQIDGVWTTTWIPNDRKLFEFPTPAPSPFLAEKIRRHERAVAIECHFQLHPNPIGRSWENSLFPYILLCVEPESHFVLGVKVLSTEKQSYEQLISSVPDAFLRLCDKDRCRPAVIRTDSAMTAALLAATADALAIPCETHPRLPALDDALDSMMDMMSGKM